jgi:hypothetical protein
LSEEIFVETFHMTHVWRPWRTLLKHKSHFTTKLKTFAMYKYINA